MHHHREKSRSRSPREWKKTERRGDFGGRENNVRVYVSNLPYDMRWQNIKDLFKEKIGNDVLFASVYESNGKSSGAGVVELRNKEAAEQAILIMDKLEVNGRKITVREEMEKDRRRHMQYDDGPGEGRGRGGGGGDAHMDHKEGGRVFSLDLLRELNIDLKFVTSQVFVANLDYKVTKAKLEEVFRIAGNVIDVELKVDKDGRSRGLGVVRFEHPMEAVQSICLFHCQYLYDRQIWVRMDKWIDPILQDIPKRLPNGLAGLGVGLDIGGEPFLNIGEMANAWILEMLSAQIANHQMNAMNPLASLVANPMGGIGGGMNLAAIQNQLLGQNNIATLLAALGQSGVNIGVGVGGNNQQQIPGMQQMLPAVRNDNYSQGGMVPTNTHNNQMHNNNNSGMSDMYDNGGFNSSYERHAPGSVGGGQRNNDIFSIFVKNLPPHYATQDIYNKFQTCGDIQFVDLKKDPMGRSRGCALITYFNPEATRKTISLMNGTRLEGYTLEVTTDRMA